MDPPIIQILRVPVRATVLQAPAAGPRCSRGRRSCGKDLARSARPLPEEHFVPRGRAASSTSCHHAPHRVPRTTTQHTCPRPVYTTRMATVRTLFFLVTAFLALAEARAAPTRYDQRQDGEFNVQGKLDNFLFVGVIPDMGDRYPMLTENFSDLALGALELVSSRSKDQGSIKSDETVRQEEPYSTEIIQINENRPGKESSVKKAEKNTETLNVSDRLSTPVGDGQADGAERVARNVKNFEFPKSREVPAVPGHLANSRKTPGPKTGNGGRARNIWNPDVESGRAGTSLKKQLPRRGEEKDVALPSSNADKNDVSPFVEEKRQELMLLGDGIENCGPGRRRDAGGVCQFDESAGSPL